MTPQSDRNKSLYLHIFKNYLSKSYNILKKLKLNNSIDLKIVKFENIHLTKENIIREICSKYDLKFEKFY